MPCTRSDDGKESNTAKAVNTVIKFKENEDIFFNKKIIRHKMKIIQRKKHKIGAYEVHKYHYHVLM